MKEMNYLRMGSEEFEIVDKVARDKINSLPSQNPIKPFLPDRFGYITQFSFPDGRYCNGACYDSKRKCFYAIGDYGAENNNSAVIVKIDATTFESEVVSGVLTINKLNSLTYNPVTDKIYAFTIRPVGSEQNIIINPTTFDIENTLNIPYELQYNYSKGVLIQRTVEGGVTTITTRNPETHDVIESYTVEVKYTDAHIQGSGAYDDFMFLPSFNSIITVDYINKQSYIMHMGEGEKIGNNEIEQIVVDENGEIYLFMKFFGYSECYLLQYGITSSQNLSVMPLYKDNLIYFGDWTAQSSNAYDTVLANITLPKGKYVILILTPVPSVNIAIGVSVFWTQTAIGGALNSCVFYHEQTAQGTVYFKSKQSTSVNFGALTNAKVVAIRVGNI